MRRFLTATALALAVTVATSTAASAQTVTTTTPAPGAAGITGSTITVGGIVAGDEASAGAEIGAQARIARANAHGGVGGRTVQYMGTETDGGDPVADRAAIARLGAQVFAVVPAASAALDTTDLTARQLPFFGAASNQRWTGNRFGFGYAGAQVPAASIRVSPAWGITLRALFGAAKGRTLAIATDPDAAGALRAQQARASLRAVGFTVPVPVVIAAASDAAAVATALAAAGGDGVVLLTADATTSSVAAALAAQGYTGTVATPPAAYQPSSPARGTGLTVLLPYAPPEQPTKANRRLAADVERFAPGTTLSAGLVDGYWAADAFLAGVATAGRHPSAAKIRASLRSFTASVPGTVGPTVFPRAHSQPAPCGALVQGDGTRYLVAVTYRCGTPVAVAGPSRSTAKSTAK